MATKGMCDKGGIGVVWASIFFQMGNLISNNVTSRSYNPYLKNYTLYRNTHNLTHEKRIKHSSEYQSVDYHSPAWIKKDHGH